MTTGTDLAHREEGNGSRAVSIPMDQRMAMLREALTNPEVNVEKAVAMADLMWRMEDREREAEFNRAKMAAISEIPAIFKRGNNTFNDTRYAKFEDYHRAVMPVLLRHGLSLDFRIGSEGRDITVQPLLRHINGYVEEGGIMRGPPDAGKGRSDIQAVGSASSYLKRYSMRAMLNIVEDGEDDDGIGGRPGDLMNDRQQRLVIDAEAAAAKGDYAAWYGRQTNKDKAWLVTTGVHARVGGGAVLPGPTARREEPPAEERREERRPNPEPQREERRDPPAQTQRKVAHDVSTPQGWTNQYVDDMRAAPSIDAIENVKRKGAGGLAKLSRENTKLYDLCDAAEMDARDRLAPAGQSGGGLFEGEE